MNIFVSNLSFHTSEENLKDIFSGFGIVDSVKIIAAKTDSQYGFALINMPSDIDAQAALLGMNNKEIDGQMLSVSVAEKKENHLHLNIVPRSNRFYL